ncbi:mannosyltransferase domain protein [Rhodococcus sp. MTM3W5.2]|uniref:hypothetical protein n=1 Tax=Rhodococcus sp. MTM3W5.2 TaxID=1805827 RepID=UPI000979796B|nr:hypothetical protein [Rhodococcus sp. MTM3W5.2]AQA21206.1 mannosyltransferase domain protein [Rhodococcus sp. MTM3W5.2]
MWVLTDTERAGASRLLGPGNVWWQFEPFRFAGSALYRTLASDGFVIDQRTPVNHTQVVRMVRANW